MDQERNGNKTARVLGNIFSCFLTGCTKIDILQLPEIEHPIRRDPSVSRHQTVFLNIAVTCRSSFPGGSAGDAVQPL
jgi:hypothetical protein